jgi:hypothetical protein
MNDKKEVIAEIQRQIKFVDFLNKISDESVYNLQSYI